MKDRLFDATHCERCNNKLVDIRTVSWFSEETICGKCLDKEVIVKVKLLKKYGHTFEGQGCPDEFKSEL